MADDYVELAGRRVTKEPTRVIYRTEGVATLATDTTAPKQGAVLAGTSHTIPPICLSSQLDEIKYPGRNTFYALWVAPLTRTEFLAL